MHIFFSLIFLSYASPVFATEINLSNGSSAVIRAGDEARVTCGGGGGGGGHRGCRCETGSIFVRSGIDCTKPDSSGNARYGYIIKKDGVPIAGDGCWNAPESAGRSCLAAIKDNSSCREP